MRMSYSFSHGVIILSGPPGEQGELSPDTEARYQGGLELWKEVGGLLIPVGSASQIMHDRLGLEAHGPTEQEVQVESLSSDTVGNALYTKRDVLEPHGLIENYIVSADYHIRRANQTFITACGPNYTFTPLGVGSPYPPEKLQQLRDDEAKYDLISKIAFMGHNPESPRSDARVMFIMRHTFARSRYK